MRRNPTFDTLINELEQSQYSLSYTILVDVACYKV